jgi:hypothetical protein
MKYIITENQREKIIQQLVKSNGFRFAARVVGSPERVIDIGFDNNLDEFLDLFSDMTVRKLKSTLWVYSTGHFNIVLYNPRKKEAFVNYNDFYAVLTDRFNLTKDEARSITEKLLMDKYRIKVSKISFNPINQSL